MTMARTVNYSNKSFEVSYVLQPIFSRDGNIAFFEVLGRVKNSNGSSLAVNPHIASKYTKMLIEYVYNITKMNYLPKSKLSLNISQSEINAEVVDFLLHLFPRDLANRVMIEVTEDVLITKNIAELLLKIKDNGFIIAFDDFCSEKSVRDLIVNYDFIDVIKFDGFFMTQILKGQNELIEALKHLVSFVKSLNKKIVIEYIENEELFLVAKDAGADYFQGFYLGKPYNIGHYREKENALKSFINTSSLVVK